MKIGDRVRLTKKAVKNFYGTAECGDGYFSINPDLKQLKQAINALDFNNGKLYGIVTSYRFTKTSVRVYYSGKLLRDFTYIDMEDLELL